MASSSFVDLSGKEVDVHKILNCDDEMIGYFLQTKPGPVKVEHLKLVPISTEKLNNSKTVENISCSHKTTNDDMEEVVVIKETFAQPLTETIDNTISKFNIVKNMNMNESLVKLPVVSDQSLSLMRPSPATDQSKAQNQLDSASATYFKPADEGWRRECKMTDNEITQVYYLTPPDNEGNFKRLYTIKSCLERCGSDSKLSRNNFTFVPRMLGLPPEFEVVRRSLSYVRLAMFEKYFILTDEVNSRGKTMVTCKLCNLKVTCKHFSTHMRGCHLPDEICLVCGLEIPCLQLTFHMQTNHNYSSGHNIYLSLPITTSPKYVTEASTLSSNQDLLVNINEHRSGVEFTPLKDLYSDAPDNDKEKNETNVVVPQEIPLQLKVISENQDFNSVINENKRFKTSGCSSSNTFFNTPVLLITFIFSDLKVRKRLQIRKDKPMSKAINKITKVMGLSPDQMTFKSGNIVLTGTELAQDLVLPEIVAERN